MPQVRSAVSTLLVLLLAVVFVPPAWSQTAIEGVPQVGAAWPTPRFTVNGDGTVTDNLTELVWLKDASCADLAGTDDDGRGIWTTARAAVTALASGTCGLTDGSPAGAWRLPNRLELANLADGELFPAALSNAAATAKQSEGGSFSGVASSFYWSASTRLDGAAGYWGVNVATGSFFNFGAKRFLFHVWPVRQAIDPSRGFVEVRRIPNPARVFSGG